MKAIVFDVVGSPLDVLQLRDIPVPQIKANEVLVKLICASVNPGDFLFIENLYPAPKTPRFPLQIAGTGGGVGVVCEVGKEASAQVGALVAFSYYNAWAEYAAVPAEWLMPLPKDYPIEKGAQFANLISAWDLLDAAKVRAGQWLALTAGNSTLATMVLQFAKRKGINVISIVRRLRKEPDLASLGANEVIQIEGGIDDLHKRLLDLTRGEGLHGVIDCVGGRIAGELIKSLALGGQMIVYGGFSAEKFEVHNFDLLMKVADIRSYAYRYFFDPPKPEDAALLSQIASAAAGPEFRIPIAGLHPLRDFRIAVEETLVRPERGKHFLSIAGENA